MDLTEQDKVFLIALGQFLIEKHNFLKTHKPNSSWGSHEDIEGIVQDAHYLIETLAEHSVSEDIKK